MTKQLTEMPPLARMILHMREQYGLREADRHRRWDALVRVRDGTYTNDYKHIPWKTRYKSNQGLAILEHQKAISLKSLPVPRAVSDSEQETADGLCDIANAAVDTVAAAFDYNRLCDGIMDDTHTLGPAILKILVKPGSDLDVKLVNPKNLHIHPAAENLADCESLVEDIPLPLSAALRRFPAKERELKRAAAQGAGGVGAVSGDGQKLYESPNDYDTVSGTMGETLSMELNAMVCLHEAFFKDSATVDVHEDYWEPTGESYADGTPKKRRAFRTKTQKRYPRGRHVIITSTGEIIADEANYDPDGRFPYIMVGAYWRAHQFWPKGDLEFMAPTVILLDEMVSAVADAGRHMAYPSFAVAPNAGLDRNLTITRPGQVWWLRNPNQSLREVRPAPMHNSVTDLIGVLDRNLRLGSNTPEESRGHRPRGDVTGRSIEAMASLASIRPGMKHANFERGMAELFQRLFGYMKKYWRARKLVVNPQANDIASRRIEADPPTGKLGNAMSPQTQYWDRDRMRASQARIIVEPGSGVPVDPQAEFMGILSLLQLLVQANNGDIRAATQIVPISYLIAHSPLRNKRMIMQRAFDAERKMGKEQGRQEGMAEELRNMPMEDLQAYVHRQAMGG